MDNEIFKNWWRESNEKFQNFDRSKTMITDQNFEVIDRRVEAIADLYKNMQEIYKALANHEERITNLEHNKEITEEEAIYFLQNSGWMKNHDKELTLHNQRTVKVIEPDCIQNYWSASGKCGACGLYLDKKHSYCPGCGSKLIWESKNEKS